MKKFYFLSIVVSLFVFFACQENNVIVDKGLSLGKLHISKSFPKQGDTISIRYEMDTTQSEIPEASYNYMVHNRYYPADIELAKVGEVYEGDLVIPDSATALAFNFNINETFDGNEKKGYVQFLYDENDSILPNSQASLGFYYITAGERFGIGQDKSTALALMENDFRRNPDLAPKWDNGYSYPTILMETKPEEGEQLIKERIKSYSKKENLSEEEYLSLAGFYYSVGNKVKQDSVNNEAIKRFPNGQRAEQLLSSKFYKEKDNDERIKIIEELESKFGKNNRNYNFMLMTIAMDFAGKKEWDEFSNYADQMSNKQEKALLYNNAAWNLAESNSELDFAESISKKSVEMIQLLQNGSDKKPDYYSVKQYEKSLNGNYNMYLDTYAYILFKQGKVQDALQYQLEALGEDKVGGRPDMNERYIQFLLANKKPKEAQDEASRYIKINKSTPKIKELLLDAYVTNKGSKDGFSDYIKDLEKVGDEKAFAVIKAKMINEDAPNFSLTNMNGKEVALTDLKGKTVILDFWATWCGPCTDSFPGMQMAVDKYRENPNVVFLFIDTFENEKFEKRKEKVENFIISNKYTFNVLYDQPVKEGSRNYMTTNDYGIKGIPTKIIIGPEGHIRFKSVGYLGNNEELLQEIQMMVELANSNTDYDFNQKT